MIEREQTRGLWEMFSTRPHLRPNMEEHLEALHAAIDESEQRRRQLCDGIAGLLRRAYDAGHNNAVYEHEGGRVEGSHPDHTVEEIVDEFVSANMGPLTTVSPPGWTLDASVNIAESANRVGDFHDLVKLCMAPETDTLFYAVSEGNKVFGFCEDNIRDFAMRNIEADAERDHALSHLSMLIESAENVVENVKISSDHIDRYRIEALRDKAKASAGEVNAHEDSLREEGAFAMRRWIANLAQVRRVFGLTREIEQIDPRRVIAEFVGEVVKAASLPWIPSPGDLVRHKKLPLTGMVLVGPDRRHLKSARCIWNEEGPGGRDFGDALCDDLELDPGPHSQEDLDAARKFAERLR